MLRQILKTRCVPAAIVDDLETAVPLAEALLTGGLDVLEVTFRTPAAAACIGRIAQACPDMCVGAGTVLTVEELEQAVAAGAKYVVTPGLGEDVVARAQALSVPIFPGVATPTEITRAWQLGCQTLKFFPAGVMGGVAALTALAGPFGHKGIRFIPTGGVDAKNAATFLSLSCVVAVGGSWMVKRELIEARRWSDITNLAREAVQICAA